MAQGNYMNFRAEHTSLNAAMGEALVIALESLHVHPGNVIVSLSAGDGATVDAKTKTENGFRTVTVYIGGAAEDDSEPYFTIDKVETGWVEGD